MKYNVVFVWLKLNIDMVIVSETQVYIRVHNCVCTARRSGVCVLELRYFQYRCQTSAVNI